MLFIAITHVRPNDGEEFIANLFKVNYNSWRRWSREKQLKAEKHDKLTIRERNAKLFGLEKQASKTKFMLQSNRGGLKLKLIRQLLFGFPQKP